MLQFENHIKFPNKQNDILTVGELLIDLISADYDENFEASTYHKFFGGSAANIAMNVKKLGIIGSIASAVGNDGLGNFLLKQLRDAGINTDDVQQVDYSTSLVLVTKSKLTPIPVFYRSADYQLKYTPTLEETLLNSKIFHFTCWPISMMPSRNTIEKLIVTARKHHILIGFDPNYHPMLWQKGEDGVNYVKSIIGKVDIIKPSEDDAERLFGKDTPLNQIKKFLDLGVKLVIMTLGKDGAIVSNGKETIQLRTLATKVADATGAGDAFWSGFYAALVNEFSIKEALNSGLAVSAYKLKYTGAVVELPKLNVIREQFGL